jgi:hypothetical protein
MAPLVHHLRPVITYSSPSRSTRVPMLVASLLATSGSVMANADRISPASSGSSHCFFCSSVPSRCSSSMLPVSGAAQLMASGARSRLHPDSSAIGAYSSWVSPDSAGRNRFHSPRSRARRLSSSTTGGTSWPSGPAARRCAR